MSWARLTVTSLGPTLQTPDDISKGHWWNSNWHMKTEMLRDNPAPVPLHP
jgi:hypothetical protein